MGQFLDYIASVFTGRVEPVDGAKANKSSSNHVTFADNSFTQAFSRVNDQDKLSKTDTVKRSNKVTIYAYQTVATVAFLLHLSLFTLRKTQEDGFDISKPEGWQPITLSLVPLSVYLASISAMNEINRPLLEGAKISSKTLSLDLNQNEFVKTLKFIIHTMVGSQLLTIYSDQFLWMVIYIIPIWCFKLTTTVAHFEYQRLAPSTKRQWYELNVSKSPTKIATPSKPAKIEAQAAATPRTRTRRAVKNIINGVSESYHAFEQNVAHQISQKVFKPVSPRLKMIGSHEKLTT